MGRALNRLSAIKVRTANATLECTRTAAASTSRSRQRRAAISTRVGSSVMPSQKQQLARTEGNGRRSDKWAWARSIRSALPRRGRRPSNVASCELQGIDPIAARSAERANAALDAARAMTFDQCRDAYIADHRAGWRNVKHASQWTNTLTAYVSPVFGKVPVAAIDTGLVTKVLRPLWATKPETAGRVRGRVEAILDWAAAQGYRQGDNPARWRGHLDKLLPARIAKCERVVHHAALPYDEMPPFMAALREREGIAARALEFTILTAARTGEVLGATWDEMNLKVQALDCARRANEGRAGAPSSARRCRNRGAEADACSSAERVRVSRGTAGHDEQHGNGHAAAANGPRRYGPRFSQSRSRIGPASGRTSRTRSAKPRSRMLSATRSRRLIGGVICLRSVGG